MKGKPKSMLFMVFALALPTMLEQLMQTAVQYIDTAMVGSLGTNATATVGSTSTVNWLIGSTVSAIGVGFLAYISQALGKDEKDKAGLASMQAVIITLIVGVALTAIVLALSPVVPILMQVDEGLQKAASRYFFILYTPMLFRAASIILGTVLRAAGDTKSPMFVGIGMNVVNVGLNFLFIYPTRTVRALGLTFTMRGLGLGTDGAAIASAISYCLGGIAITIVLFFNKKVSFRGRRFKLEKDVLKPCFKVALPNLVQRFATSFGYVVFASMINSIGEVATAAHTIANTVESAFYIPGWGMQTAAATIAGNAYGADDDNKLKSLTKMSILLEGGLMIISGALLFIFAPQLMGIFSKDPEVISLGAKVLRMVALSEPFYGIAIVFEGIMQGVGNTTLPFIFNVVGMWGIRILGTLIFTVLLRYGLISAWGCMIAHNVSLFIMFLSVYLAGKWKPKKKLQI